MNKDIEDSKNDEYVDPAIYDADYYLVEGYEGDSKVFLDNLDKYEYLYDYPIELAKLKPDEKVLDIGCGVGKLAYKTLKKQCRVVGVDYSKQAIEIANKIKMLLDREKRERITFVNQNVLNMSEDDTFDVVFITDVVEHLYNWQLKKLFSKLQRILNRPKGRIIIHTAPNRINIKYLYPLKRFLNFPSTLRNRKGFFYKRSKHFYAPKMHVNEQTMWSLKKHLKDFDRTIWCEDFSKNILSILTSKFLGNHIWAIAKPKE